MNFEQFITIIEQKPAAEHFIPLVKSGSCKASKPERQRAGLFTMSVNATSSAGFFTSALKSGSVKTTGETAADLKVSSKKGSEFAPSLGAKPVVSTEPRLSHDESPFAIQSSPSVLVADPEPSAFVAHQASPTYTIKAIPWHDGDFTSLKAVSLYRANQFLSRDEVPGVEALPRISVKV